MSCCSDVQCDPAGTNKRTDEPGFTRLHQKRRLALPWVCQSAHMLTRSPTYRKWNGPVWVGEGWRERGADRINKWVTFCLIPCRDAFWTLRGHDGDLSLIQSEGEILKRVGNKNYSFKVGLKAEHLYSEVHNPVTMEIVTD